MQNADADSGRPRISLASAFGGAYVHDARCDAPMLHPGLHLVWRNFLNERTKSNASPFDSPSLYLPVVSAHFTASAASFRFRLGRNYLIRISVADRLSQRPWETRRRPFQCFPRARRETSDERGGYRAGSGTEQAGVRGVRRARLVGHFFSRQAGDLGTPTFSNLEGRVRRSTFGSLLLRQTS